MEVPPKFKIKTHPKSALFIAGMGIKNRVKTSMRQVYSKWVRVQIRVTYLLDLKLKKGPKYSTLPTQTRQIDPIVIVFYNVYISE